MVFVFVVAVVVVVAFVALDRLPPAAAPLDNVVGTDLFVTEVVVVVVVTGPALVGASFVVAVPIG